MAHYNLGLIHYEKKEYDNAVAEFKKAIELNPNDVFSHYAIGNIHRDKGDMENAVKEWQNAVNILPRFSLARHEIGNYYNSKGQSDKAAAEFETIIKNEPYFTSAYVSMGFILIDKGDLDKAIDMFTNGQKANKEENKRFYFLDGLGWANYKKGKYKEALDYLQEAIKLIPAAETKYLAQVHYHLGMAFMAAGNKPLARQNLEKAIELDRDETFAADIKKALNKTT